MDYKTSTELDAMSIEEMLTQTSITNVSPGARGRGLVEIFNRRASEIYDKLQMNTRMGFIRTAQGVFLDLLGPGLARQGAIASVVDHEDEAIKFYSIGPLKAQLPTGIIPEGTLVSNATGSVQFRVVEDAPFDDVTDHVYVSAVAMETGAGSRVGKDILTQHSLGVTDVMVTNTKGITTGEDAEEDDNYRFRLANKRAQFEAANHDALRISMLPVAGVSDIIIKEYPGYIDVLVLPSGNTVQESVIQACAFLGNRAKAGGIRLVCRGPRMVPFEIYVQAQLSEATPSSDREVVKLAIKAAILDYFDDIPLGGAMVISELSSRIQDSHAGVYDHKVICFNARRSPQLLRNFRLMEDEMFMPDPEADNAIVVTVT